MLYTYTAKRINEQNGDGKWNEENRWKRDVVRIRFSIRTMFDFCAVIYALCKFLIRFSCKRIQKSYFTFGSFFVPNFMDLAFELIPFISHRLISDLFQWNSFLPYFSRSRVSRMYMYCHFYCPVCPFLSYIVSHRRCTNSSIHSVDVHIQ